MDQTACGSTAYAFGADIQLEVGGDGVKFVGASVEGMGGVCDHPQFSGPWDEGADSALAAWGPALVVLGRFVESGQMGVYAAYADVVGGM